MDRRRLADIRAGTADRERSCGSGYVVGQRLVLTCRHVIHDDQDRPWPRLEVWLGHPADGSRRRATAVVAWVHPDHAQDAALLRIEGEPFTGTPLVRWGCFARAPACSGLMGVCPACTVVGRNRTVVSTDTPR